MKKFKEKPFYKVRRSDRAMEDDGWIRSFLQKAPVGFLATTIDKQPFINSNLFAYDEKANVVYMHTAAVGKTKDNIEQNPKVCFHVSAMGRFLPAPVALEFSVEFAGVTIFGTASIVENDAEAENALQMILDKYAPHLRPGRDYREIVPEEIARTTVYRIAVDHLSGKRKKVEKDFPGAFLYGNDWEQDTIRFEADCHR